MCRDVLPDVPLMALSATATGLVQDDIVQALGMRKGRTKRWALGSRGRQDMRSVQLHPLCMQATSVPDGICWSSIRVFV